MSDNYDHPPASSRRPSIPSDQSSPLVPDRGTFQQRLWDPTRINADERVLRDLRELEARRNDLMARMPENSRHSERQPSDEYESDLDTILSDVQFANPTARLLDRLLIDQASRTPRENQPSDRPRERLIYLRNLIHQESSHINTEDTLRALETLNQEIEDHYRDQARSGQITYQQAQHSRRALLEQIPQLQAAVVASANLEPRPASNRGHRRRSFRSDLRDSLPTPSLMPQSQSNRDRDRDRRQKRRKLDADDNREGSRGFNYGHQGQVVPGALKMEIASCDGGVFDPDPDSFFPGNVLRNDLSVYSTKSNRWNLILRHRDEAPFCLKKLVIKAPRSGFDSPYVVPNWASNLTKLGRIQEGMVFVSMTSDELLARTAKYKIEYSNPRRRRGHRRMIQPSQEYLSGFRTPLQTLERTVLMDPDSGPNSVHPAGRDAHDPQAEFRVTTEYNETTEDNVFVARENDDLTSATELERANELDDLLCSDTDDDSPSDDDDEDHPMTRRRLEIQRRIGSMRRQNSDPSQRRRQPPSLIDPIPLPPAPGPAMPTPNTEVLKPHARFFIEREKSVVSIKFDPPPSGRFILIKLWSPRSEGNIDIQSIIAHGYAGPRFFPSGGFR